MTTSIVCAVRVLQENDIRLEPSGQSNDLASYEICLYTYNYTRNPKDFTKYEDYVLLRNNRVLSGTDKIVGM